MPGTVSECHSHCSQPEPEHLGSNRSNIDAIYSRPQICAWLVMVRTTRVMNKVCSLVLVLTAAAAAAAGDPSEAPSSSHRTKTFADGATYSGEWNDGEMHSK